MIRSTSDRLRDLLPLYVVKRTGRIGWDETSSVVVAAATAYKARVLASNASQDEGPLVWLDARQSRVHKIAPVSIYTRPRVILSEGLSG